MWTFSSKLEQLCCSVDWSSLGTVWAGPLWNKQQLLAIGQLPQLQSMRRGGEGRGGGERSPLQAVIKLDMSRQLWGALLCSRCAETGSQHETGTRKEKTHTHTRVNVLKLSGDEQEHAGGTSATQLTAFYKSREEDTWLSPHPLSLLHPFICPCRPPAACHSAGPCKPSESHQCVCLCVCASPGLVSSLKRKEIF